MRKYFLSFRILNFSKPILCLILSVSAFAIFAQPALDNIKAVDSIYADNIQTVQLTTSLLGSNVAMMNLGQGALKLIFDDLNNEIKDYLYTIDQFDRNWQPSKLEKIEYLDGFTEERINNFKNSFATNVPFVHYELVIPNATVRLTKSGNYLLRVYEDTPEKTLVLTRRFVIIEPILTPVPATTSTSSTNYNTHQELDFSIELKTFRVQNPMNEIRVSVIQNGRWDNAHLLVPPTYVQGDRIIYDYQDTIAFNAGKEWRYVDLRSSRFRSERVARIDKGDETWEVTLRPDLDRSREPYLIYPDLNGGYFVETQDFTIDNDNSLRADYLNVHFSLFKKEELEEKDVYIFGSLTDWKINDKYKLTYNSETSRYESSLSLKQGFYNYAYVTIPKGKKQFDCSELEGDWYETENEYTFLIYLRAFGARYDRVVGFYKYRTNRR